MKLEALTRIRDARIEIVRLRNNMVERTEEAQKRAGGSPNDTDQDQIDLQLAIVAAEEAQMNLDAETLENPK